MSDGITLYCPSCGKLTALKKEYDQLRIKLKEHSLKHPEDDEWYDSNLPVYTCQSCKFQSHQPLIEIRGLLPGEAARKD